MKKRIIGCLLLLLVLLGIEKISQSNSVTEETILVGRIYKGIIDFKQKRHGTFYVCGKNLTGLDLENYVLSISSNVVLESRKYQINPWGVIGVMFNESSFDMCALGKPVRSWGIENRFIKKKRTSISYTENEVLSIVNDRDAQNRFNGRFDLGLCQILSKYHNGPTKELLTVEPGISLCVEKMRERTTHYRPWRFWPGKETDWYDDKIIKWARKMGAKENEI